MAWKEYCAEYWFKELQESMDRCNGRSNITKILLKMALSTIQPSANQRKTFEKSCLDGGVKALCGSEGEGLLKQKVVMLWYAVL